MKAPLLIATLLLLGCERSPQKPERVECPECPKCARRCTMDAADPYVMNPRVFLNLEDFRREEVDRQIKAKEIFPHNSHVRDRFYLIRYRLKQGKVSKEDMEYALDHWARENVERQRLHDRHESLLEQQAALREP